MRKGFIGAISLGIILFVGLICTIICIEKIPVGYEGVVYDISGGVEDVTIKQGWHIVSPTKRVKKFTVGNEQLILSQNKREGSEADESFKVSTADNASISISFQMSYRYMPDKIVDTYKKFKGMDGTDIVTSRVRTVLKAKISEVTTDYSMMDIYSGNKSTINAKITRYLNEAFEKSYGIEVLDASIIDVHPDVQLQRTINDRVTALQRKQQAEAEQEAARVESETKKVKAQGEANAMIVTAQAEAEAYRIMSSQITDNLLKKWELDARQKHGWVTIQGANTVVTGQ